MTHGGVDKENCSSYFVSRVRQGLGGVTDFLSGLVHSVRHCDDLRKSTSCNLGHRGHAVELFVVLLRFCGSLGLLDASSLTQDLAGHVVLLADGVVELPGDVVGCHRASLWTVVASGEDCRFGGGLHLRQALWPRSPA